ncbi:MAG: DUF6151 family protein, partial [Myxococcota bacterium]
MRGSIEPASPDLGRRMVCMCDDCQAYAHWLGNAETVLDDVGGTDVYQTTPARVRIDQGSEHIRCMRLSPKGIFRFYTDCCRTPLGNTMPQAGVPFVGLVHTCMDHEGAGVSREDAIGPVQGRIQAQHACGPAPEGSHPKVPISLLFSSMFGLMGDRIRGQHVPNPFRNDQGEPIHPPTILTLEER